MRNKVIDIHQFRMSYKDISVFESPGKHSESYYPQMEKTWNNDEPFRGGWLSKITLRIYQQFLHEVTKEQRTCKALRTSLGLVMVSGLDSTIRKRQGKRAIHGTTAVD
ncbi:hypothetical protein ATANTOWER_021930 [Ataeniobius toweri]|uniref:Uncharacterized protein n=1 Tax=Ataeniobius toweri TaxID=208326 RepID=A0ABU7BAW9_9TELE|nr:hypothetical protein [Ataeniobius toweri]